MHRGIIRKSEWILLGMTALFLCGLLALQAHDRAQLQTQSVVTETEVPQEEILPDLTPLDLNRATVEELQKLPGVGEELAARIVAFREENGPFTAVEQIMEISGIGEGKFAALASRIVVNEEGTA
jgi:competence protein ComEA